GTSSSVTLDIIAGDNSLTVNTDNLVVKRDATGAVGLTLDGLFINTDGSTLEINANALRVKDLGITTAKLSDNAVNANKLASDALIDANRAVSTNHIRDTSITSDKLASSLDISKFANGSVSNTEFEYL